MGTCPGGVTAFRALGEAVVASRYSESEGVQMREMAMDKVLRVLRAVRASIHPSDPRPPVGELVAAAARVQVRSMVSPRPWTAEALEAAVCAALAHSGRVPDSGVDPVRDVEAYSVALKARGARQWLSETIEGIEAARYALDLLMDEMSDGGAP